MIDPRRLRVLRAVADHQTVTAAAAALYLTPSAVSQQLNTLEQETGQHLLTRSGKGVKLTSAGELLLRHADAVLMQLEKAEAELAAFAAGEAGEVVVAGFATGITEVLAPASARLRESHPGISFRVNDLEGDAALQLLLDGELDIALAVDYRGAPREDDARLTRFSLYVEPFDVVLPANHPALAATEISLAELADEVWIGPYQGNPLHSVVWHACEQSGFEPVFRHHSDDFRAVVALVQAGAGVALIPRSALRGIDLNHVVVRPVKGPVATRRVFAAVRNGASGHPLVRVALAAMQEIAAQVSEYGPFSASL